MTATPRTLVSAVRRVVGGVRRRLLGHAAPEPDGFLDIGDISAVNAVLGRHGLAPLTDEPGQDTARFILGMLVSRSELRRRFPTALSDGPEDTYCHWLTTGNGLSPTAAVDIRAVFESDPGERVRRIYEFRPDMRTAFPFGMTPQQRGEYLDWLLTHGAAEMGVTPVQALWFLLQIDETPDRGLVPTYLLNPDWQARVPHGLTVFGWGELLHFLRTECGLRGRWQEELPTPRVYGPWDQLTLLRHARPELNATFPLAAAEAGDAAAVVEWLDRQPDLVKPDTVWRMALMKDVHDRLPTRAGVNLLGHFRYPSGLQQVVHATAKAFEAVGLRTSLRDLPTEYPSDLADRTHYHGVELFDATVYCASVNTPAEAHLSRSGLHLRPGVRRVAVWYWETEEVPETVPEHPAPFDEVWAPTRFISDAFRKRVKVPVVPMLPGLEPLTFAPRPRSHFGLRDDRFAFLFTFDMASLMVRKNPLASVAAFRQAFRRDEPVDLVIKVARGNESPADLAALTAACEANGVRLIDELMPRSDLLALMAACDCYVSLHRSEGLGLGMAETMLMGKPVIATGYSGNLDFMTPETSYLVEYERVPIPESVTQYPRGSHWAEPSVEHAAELMRRVYDNRDETRAVGERARAAVSELMSLEAFGRRMATRLQAIARG
ncbi:MAG TPA: glycosyltransferase family 4 protein [Fimbriiglobus sp.]|nr:glycosyltransferase family 4 protein [Fimbriiglobus sp.]